MVHIGRYRINRHVVCNSYRFFVFNQEVCGLFFTKEKCTFRVYIFVNMLYRHHNFKVPPPPVYPFVISFFEEPSIITIF